MNLFATQTGIRLRRGLTKSLVCSLMLVLPSCRTPELRGPELSQVVPETFNGVSSPDSSAHVSIDEFFTDPILTGLIYQGLAGNQELKILGEEIQIANNEVLRRRGAYLPFVTIGGRAGLEKNSQFTPLGAAEEQLTYRPGRNFPTPLPNFLGATSVSWQVDIWRQLRNARDAACLRYLGSIDGRNYVVTRLVSDIAENYYSLLALDKRNENLDRIIALQQESLEKAEAKKEFAQGTELAVQRFKAEVNKNQSEKLLVKQEIIETENRINFLAGRFPQPVERSAEFYELTLPALNLGIPSDLLLNRPDIRQAERELAATDLDVLVARANFYPKLNISLGVGYEAFNPRYILNSPESLIYGVAGDLVAPLLNKTAIKADYMSANAKQLQALYNYQRVILNAFTEVINRVNMVQNYSESIEIKKQQLDSLEKSVEAATNLFQAARVDYIDVLLAQRDLNDARLVLIETKRKQLTAIVDTYQSLGGGLVTFEYPGVAMATYDAPLPAGSSPIAPTPAPEPVPAAPGNTLDVPAPNN